MLKFGGSVLPDPGALPACVAEVRRWRAAGHEVVAVVSALRGRTDQLLAECRAISPSLSPFAVAARIAVGELESAGLLGVQLDAAGVDAAVLGPAALRLCARGAPLDAEPVALALAPLRAALRHHGTVVVPGFAAVDPAGRTVVLGRGGSDLTALFLAQRLGARCRLLKDVDGLFTVDPARGAAPRRLLHATWTELRRVGGRMVQHKAVAFAAAHGLSFELSALGGAVPTIVGGGATGDRAHG